MSEDTNEIKKDVALEDSLTKALKRAEELAAAPSETKSEEKTQTTENATADEEPDMNWPLPVYPLVAKFDVQNVVLEDGQGAVVLAVYTGSGAAFGLLSADGARALSSRLKKSANSMIS
jgi:hypothetical protein